MPRQPARDLAPAISLGRTTIQSLTICHHILVCGKRAGDALPSARSATVLRAREFAECSSVRFVDCCRRSFAGEAATARGPAGWRTSRMASGRNTSRPSRSTMTRNSESTSSKMLALPSLALMRLASSAFTPETGSPMARDPSLSAEGTRKSTGTSTAQTVDRSRAELKSRSE